MHILRMTGVLYCNRISVDGVCIVPFIGFSHKPFLFFPSSYCGLPLKESLFNKLYFKKSIKDISSHIIFIIRVLVSFRNIFIK